MEPYLVDSMMEAYLASYLASTLKWFYIELDAVLVLF